MTQVRNSFHDDLSSLEQHLLQMGSITNGMVEDAVLALMTGNVELAESVIVRDDIVDAMDIDIETRCMNLLALQQPVAKDLRQVGTAFKVITDLERVGDHAVDIAKIARKCARQFFVTKPLVDVGHLSSMSRTMIQHSLEALVRHDTGLAIKVCSDDDAVDAEFKELREELLTLTQQNTKLVLPASYMLLAVVYLERIADHATNIAERVVYVETGELNPLARLHRLSPNEPDAVIT